MGAKDPKVITNQFGIIPKGDRNFWQWGVDQTKLDYIDEPIAGLKNIWSEDGLQFNRFAKNQFPDWSDPDPYRTSRRAHHYKRAGFHGKAAMTQIPTQLKMAGKFGLSTLPVVGTVATIADVPLRVKAGQDLDDAIVGSIGSIVGGTIGSIGGGSIAALSGNPVVALAGTIAGGYGGAVKGQEWANAAWGKITNDPTWGGVREDPNAAIAQKAIQQAAMKNPSTPDLSNPDIFRQFNQSLEPLRQQSNAVGQQVSDAYYRGSGYRNPGLERERNRNYSEEFNWMM